MGKEKAGFLTPKAISNRIKAKGLQKLRWYCQMCQKQCRDENGFKCHCMSESHQRQLLLFADNPNKYLDTFSKEFFDDFMLLLKRRFGTKRVHCNIVYQEYISDREHLHMNATKWETLTGFVKWLGREGHCVVDETPKGWFITYIDKDPEVIARQKAAQAKEKNQLDDNERIAKFVEKQIEKAKDTHGEAAQSTFTELQRQNDDDKVQFEFGAAGPSKVEQKRSVIPPNKLENLMKKSDAPKGVKEKVKKRKSALHEILEEETASKMLKGKASKKENWLTTGIVVKIITKKLGEKYYKKKGVVKEVKNHFIAIVELLNSSDILQLDQNHLETVLPAIGKKVKVLNGPHCGEIAIMVKLNPEAFSAAIQIVTGQLNGVVIKNIPYEDISKIT